MNYLKFKKSIIFLIFFTNLSCFAQKGINAGVLPYFFDKSGKAFFLIGREPNGFWADFGGRAEKDEETTITAAREFSEETRYVYGKHAQGVKNLESSKPTEKFLNASIDYINKRITGKLVHPKGYYVMYLAEVDFIPATVFDSALEVPHYEKTKYSWVSVQKLVNAIRTQTDRRKAKIGKKRIRRQIFDVLKNDVDTIENIIYPKKRKKVAKKKTFCRCGIN